MENKLQQIVWAKIVGYPHWPAVIVDEMDLDIEKPIPKKSDSEFYAVRFLAEHTSAWIEQKNLCPYEENKTKYCKASKKQLFMKAMEEAETHLQNQKDDSQYRIIFKVSKKRQRSEEKKSPIKIDKDTIVADDLKDFTCGSDGTLNIGVIGIGLVGSEIVKHLIRQGHSVNICNRTYKKCKKLEKDLNNSKSLKIFITPREVLLKSDVIFICLSDDEATQKIIDWDFEASSETENIIKDKGILVMSKIKPETSRIFNEKITAKEGKYLELAFQGNRKEIIQGKLTIYSAGDEILFHQCHPYFKAIAASSYYFGSVGYALKINLIIQMIKAVSLGVFAEAISLAEKLGIPSEIFLEVFNETDITSNFLTTKAVAIIGKSFNLVEQPLKQMQAELKDVLEMSESIGHPVALTNTANEVYKDCKRLRYDSYDVSAVYLKHKYF